MHNWCFNPDLPVSAQSDISLNPSVHPLMMTVPKLWWAERTFIMHLWNPADVIQHTFSIFRLQLFQLHNIIETNAYSIENQPQKSYSHSFLSIHIIIVYVFLSFCILLWLNYSIIFTTINTYISYWRPNVSLRMGLEMVLTWTMMCTCSWPNTWNNVNCTCLIISYELVLSTLLHHFFRGATSMDLRCASFLKNLPSRKSIENDILRTFVSTTFLWMF